MVIGDLARLNAARYRNKIAFKDERREISFELVNQRMNAFTRSLLDRGLEKGDRIAVLLHNCAMSPLSIICPKQHLERPLSVSSKNSMIMHLFLRKYN